jgi:hypothetical protein
MDRSKNPISPHNLYAGLGSGSVPIVVEDRREADFARAERLVVPAFHCSANFPDDHEMLKRSLVIYDALYTWCRSLQAETHNWPARAVGA